MSLRDIRYSIQDTFRRVALWGALAAGVTGFGTYMYGLPNSENGRRTLEKIGVKVVEDQGHPPFGFGGGSGLFSSRFTIENTDGSREDVVVSRGLSAPTSITFKNR